MIDTKYRLPGPKKDEIGHKLASFIDRELDEVVAAYLFGSFSDAGQFSDIDLGLNDFKMVLTSISNYLKWDNLSTDAKD